MLSSSVMLGVAAEHTFILLLEAAEKSPSNRTAFAAVRQERTILPMINKFRRILDQRLKTMPAEIREDLDTRFSGILSVIRTFRNQSGHPSGEILDRDQAFVNLQLFIPYCRKMYQLKAHLGK